MPKYEEVAAPPQHPFKTRLHSYSETVNGIEVIGWIELGIGLTALEMAEALELHLPQDRRTRRYRQAKALLDTVKHYLGYDVGPLAAPKAPETTAECSSCYKEKPLREFGRDERKVNGRKSICLKCDSLKTNDRYFRRKERLEQNEAA